MKKTFIVFMTLIFFLSLAAPSAFAGSKQRHRWQGVAIGLGAAILGNAIINNSRDYDPPERVIVHKHRGYNYSCCPPRHHPDYKYSYDKPRYHNRHYKGHWEVQKTWIPPVHDQVWNPGHYNRHHQWVPGQWITIEKSTGYWSKEKVWVAHR